MSDFKSKLHSARAKFLRRVSGRIDTTSTAAATAAAAAAASLSETADGRSNSVPTDPHPVLDQPENPSRPPALRSNRSDPQISSVPLPSPPGTAHEASTSAQPIQNTTNDTQKQHDSPELLVEAPTPDLTPPAAQVLSAKPPAIRPPTPETTPSSPTTVLQHPSRQSPSPESARPTSKPAPSLSSRTSKPQDISPPEAEYFGTATRTMASRKVWIKRTGASPTLVQISGDDLVDDVRDKVLRKYANSLGRTFDAPDVSVRIIPRERSHPERILGPEEPICNIIDAYFPGGQTIEEALLIDVPRRRTPLPSPRIVNQMGSYFEDSRPNENGTGYFPPMPVTAVSPHPSQSAASHDSRHSYHQETNPHSIAVLETGQLPVLPSPREKRGHHRPKYSRHHTSSPTVVTNTTSTGGHPVNSAQAQAQALASRQQYSRGSADARRSVHGPASHQISTPPAADVVPKSYPITTTTPPLERIDSPRITKPKKNRKLQSAEVRNQDDNGRKDSHAPPQAAFSFIEATIPPINVLIVEDNVINLRLLEAFTRRLKVRWQTAMNGKEAVTKWKAGGFHLVLMDIQLPIMSGLEATKEIRRLESVNGIGVFAKSQLEDSTASQSEEPSENAEEKPEGDDKLGDGSLFKSPVIIVALTASSLQSDRHEALAAGCNDFLTKPVGFLWLERKVMEWGCMQALIDFDGWRKWKDLAAAADEKKKLEEDLNPELKEKREKKAAKRAALLEKFGTGAGA